MNTLTLVVVAKDSARFIGRMLKQSRLYADYVMAFVDISSTDNTFDVCKKYADETLNIETPGYIEPVLSWVYSLPPTTHIIRLDSDELIGERFVKNKKEYLNSPYNAFWFPRYNLVGKLETHYFDRLYPDLQLRMFRKGKIEPSPIIHISPQISGRDVITESHIFHVKYGQRTKRDREILMRQYDSIRNGSGSSKEYRYFQIPEDMPVKTMKECEEKIAE